MFQEERGLEITGKLETRKHALSKKTQNKVKYCPWMQRALSCNNCSTDYIVIETSRHLINKCVLNDEVY